MTNWKSDHKKCAKINFIQIQVFFKKWIHGFYMYIQLNCVNNTERIQINTVR